MSALREDVLGSLTPDSSLLVVLRTLYRLRLECGVLLREDFLETGPAEPLVFSKDHLVSLIERAAPETLVKDLPKLAEQGFFRPVEVEEGERTEALVVEKRGAWVEPLWEALLPREPEYPEWWDAPLPFALCDRGRVHVNRTALLMFGPDLERLPVPDLPDRDEFLVELEGREAPCFLSFRRLEPDVFILEDSTGDLIEAQELSWWASVGKAWTKLLDEERRPWRRADSPAASDPREQVHPCDWEGRRLGYFCVGGRVAPKRGHAAKKEAEPTAPKRGRPKKAAPEVPKREDEVLKAIGPQTMGLLAAGQLFEEPGSAAPPKEEAKARAFVRSSLKDGVKKER